MRKAAYRVRGEVGQYSFGVYDSESGNQAHNFRPQRGKAFRQTVGFRNRYLYQGCTNRSYRQVAKAYHQECFQREKTCSSRSFQDMVVREGYRIEKAIQQWSVPLLQDQGMTIKHHRTIVPQELVQQASPRKRMDCAELTRVFDQLYQQAAPEIQEHLCLDDQAYESAPHTINISIDDVCCKRQKEKRTALSKEESEQQRQVDSQYQGGRKNYKRRKFLYQCVTHFESTLGQHTLVGRSLKRQLGPISAFLLVNKGLQYNWVFFVDGQRSLNECIEKRFSWRQIDMVLDWYHLHKKLKYQSFLALKKCVQRDQVLHQLKKYLWYGLVDQAVNYLQQIDQKLIKNKAEVEVLVGYLHRNQAYIKCYALRKKLDLRTSSNRVEKANDQLVASRQKSNGMSFTRPGASALALLTNVHINGQTKLWLKHGILGFKWAA